MVPPQKLHSRYLEWEDEKSEGEEPRDDDPFAEGWTDRGGREDLRR